MATARKIQLVVAAVALAGLPMLAARDASARDVRIGAMSGHSIGTYRAAMHPILDHASSASNQKARKPVGVQVIQNSHESGITANSQSRPTLHGAQRIPAK
jgi:hypothetical protein